MAHIILAESKQGFKYFDPAWSPDGSGGLLPTFILPAPDRLIWGSPEVRIEA